MFINPKPQYAAIQTCIRKSFITGLWIGYFVIIEFISMTLFLERKGGLKVYKGISASFLCSSPKMGFNQKLNSWIIKGLRTKKKERETISHCFCIQSLLMLILFSIKHRFCVLLCSTNDFSLYMPVVSFFFFILFKIHIIPRILHFWCEPKTSAWFCRLSAAITENWKILRLFLWLPI